MTEFFRINCNGSKEEFFNDFEQAKDAYNRRKTAIGR